MAMPRSAKGSRRIEQLAGACLGLVGQAGRQRRAAAAERAAVLPRGTCTA